jgi:hypothetical protein
MNRSNYNTYTCNERLGFQVIKESFSVSTEGTIDFFGRQNMSLGVSRRRGIVNRMRHSPVGRDLRSDGGATKNL